MQLIIMLFTFIQPFQLMNLSQTTASKIILAANEQFSITHTSVIVSGNNEKELINNVKNNQDLLLLEERERFFINSTNNIFAFTSDNRESNLICAVRKDSIDCLIQVENCLYDKEIRINQISLKHIEFNVTGCIYMHKIRDGIFLLQSEINATFSIFVIIDQNGIVFNSISIENSENCKLKSIFYFDQLIIYEANCTNSKLQYAKINLSNLSFYSNDQINLVNTELNITDQISGKLLEISFCSQRHFILYYEQVLLQYDLQKSQVQIWNSLLCEITMIDFQEIIVSRGLSSFAEFKRFTIQYLCVNDNLIILFNNQITAINNQYLNQTLPSKFISIQRLANLPYFVSLTQDSYIVFIKVNQFAQTLRYMDSKYIATYRRFYFKVSLEIYKIYETILFDIQNPTIIFFNKEEMQMSLHISDNNDITMERLDISSISFGLPAMLTHIDYQDGSISAFSQFFTQCQNVDPKIFSERFYILKRNDSNFSILYQKVNGNLIIIDCQQNNQSILYYQTYGKIFPSCSAPNFALQLNFTLLLFKVSQQGQIILHSQFKSDSLYLIKQNRNLLSVLLQNCTIYQINIQELNINQLYQYPFPNCTQSIEFRLQALFVSTSQLFHQNINYFSKRISLSNIIFAEAIGGNLLIIQLLSKDNIIAKLFYAMRSLEFLYQLPTYYYQFIYPIQCQFYSSYFAIIGQNNQQQEFILIYNLKNRLSNCLIAIIQIDQGNYIFNFLNDDTIYYIFNDTIKFLAFTHVQIKFKVEKEFDDNQYSTQAYFTFKSQIFSQTEKVTMHLNYINNKQRLRFRQNSTQLYLSIDDLAIINLNSIFGNIQRIELLSNSSARIEEPIQQLNVNITCQNYKKSCCLQLGQLICDVFGASKLIQLDTEMEKLHITKIYDVDLYLSQYTLVFQVNFGEIFILFQAKLMSNIKTHPYTNNFKCVFLNHNLFLFYFITRIDAYYFNNTTGLQYSYINIDEQYPEDTILKLNEQELILCQFNQFNQILFTKFSITSEKIINDSALTANISDTIQQSVSSVSNYLLISKKIIGNQLEIIFFLDFSLNYGYIYQYVIDLKQLILESSHLMQFIRYGHNIHCEKVLYGNEESLILKLRDALTFESEIVVYSINNHQQGQSIDYIYQYHNSDIDEVSEYNSTHLVFIKQYQDTKIVELVTLGKYRLKCDQYCQDKYDVLLTNQISTMKSQIHKYISSNNERSTAVGIILISNLWLMVIFIFYFKKPYQLAQQQDY